MPTKRKHLTTKGLTPVERTLLELRADIVVLHQVLKRLGIAIPRVVTHRLRFSKR